MSAQTVLSASTFLGGSGFENATAAAVDGAGYIYVAGWTDSADLHTVGAIQATTGGGVDAFVAKLSPDGQTVIYCSYLGGSGDDRAFGVAVDGNGSAYVTGSTTSRNFTGAQNASSGGRDAFVAKLSPSGNTLVYSLYFGGAGADAAAAIALDRAGNAYITGDTTSGNLPVLNAFRSRSQGQTDVFVAKFGAWGNLLYSTYLGGSSDDSAKGIAVDGTGSAYITGATNSPDFPMVNAFQSTPGGNQDAFVAKLNPSGDRLVYSTYLGGGGGVAGSPEWGAAIAVDSAGAAYVTGTSSSNNFPVKASLFGILNGASDAFVAKLNPGGGLSYSTLLGGSGVDYGQSIAVDASGVVYVGGYTSSVDFPTMSPLQGSNAGLYDGFLAQISPAGDRLLFSTYLGGSASDAINAIATWNGGVYAVGQTQSNNFPLVNASSIRLAGAMDGFITWMAIASAAPSVTGISPNSGYGSTQVFTVSYDNPGGGANLAGPRLIINSSLSAASACLVFYDAPSNAFYLANDSSSAWAGPGVVAGTGNSTSNSQCVLDGSGSAATITGNTLRVSYSLTFRPSFWGSKTAYAYTENQLGMSSGYKAIGSWTIPGLPPTATFDTPLPGSVVSGASVFVSGFAIDNGAQLETAIHSVQVFVDNVLAGTASYGLSRPDVCAYFFPRLPTTPSFIDTMHCPANTGYSFLWNSKTVTNGSHVMKVVISDSESPPQQRAWSIPIIVAN